MKLYILLGIIIFILLYLLPLQLLVDYQRKNNKDNLIMKINFFFLHYNLKLTFIDFKRLFSFPTTELKGKFKSLFSETNIEFKEEISEEELESLQHSFKVMRRIVNRFELILLLTHNCSFFSWQTSFGFANPAHTGILTGVLWSGKSSLISLLQTQLEFKELPIIKVCPNFKQQQPLRIQFKGIFTFKLGKLILIAMGIIYFETTRRLKQKWKNIQLLN